MQPRLSGIAASAAETSYKYFLTATNEIHECKAAAVLKRRAALADHFDQRVAPRFRGVRPPIAHVLAVATVQAERRLLENEPLHARVGVVPGGGGFQHVRRRLAARRVPT